MSAKKTAASAIPKETDRETIRARRALIKNRLARMVGKGYACPCLGVKVWVTAKGVAEVAQWASMSYLSTLAAIDLNYSVDNGFWEIKTASPRNSEAVMRKPLIWEGARPSGGNGYRPY